MAEKRRLSLMVDEEMFAAIERARGDVARERWLRRAVERALGESPIEAGAFGASVTGGEVHAAGSGSSPAAVSPAPAEPEPSTSPEQIRKLTERSVRIPPARPFRGPYDPFAKK